MSCARAKYAVTPDQSVYWKKPGRRRRTFLLRGHIFSNHKRKSVDARIRCGVAGFGHHEFYFRCYGKTKHRLVFTGCHELQNTFK